MPRRLIRTIMPGLLAGILLTAPAVHANEAPLIEHFDTLDRSVWMVSHGWSNGSHQGCTWSRSQVAVADGVLRMSLSRSPEDPNRMLCAELQSREKRHYGLYEVRMRPVAGGGMVSAFFTYTGPHANDPHDEIDFEFLGKSPWKVQLNYYTGGVGDHEAMIGLPAAGPDRFAVYSFLWEPDRIAWFIDGRLVHEVTGPDMPVTAGKLYLSLWNGTSQVRDWLATFVAPSEPMVMEVDWVAFSPPGSSCLVEGSVSCDPAFAW